ncbi:MAG: alpha/beta hydrolase [Bradymonadia bacterium]
MRVLTQTACLLTLLSFGISGCESADQQNDVTDGGIESPDGTPESADGGNEMNDGGDDVVDNDLYADWFAGYNEGQDTTYLDNGGTIYDDGDTNRYPAAPSHTFIEGAAYGPFSRNVLDIYLPNDVSGPTPVAVYIHGGGFSSGDKTKIHQGKGDIAAYLADGIAVASISYRYGASHSAAAQTAIIPNGECDGSDGGCRKDYVFRDGARAIQYIRYRAEDWNIDPSKIATWGSSAGGQIVMWIATTPNLAVADHPDPVLREDSRVQVVGHMTSQVSALNSHWPDLLNFSDMFWQAIGWSDESYDKMLQGSLSDIKNTIEGQKLLQVIDYYGAISEASPPIMAACSVNDHSEEMMLNPDNADDLQSNLVHHPSHSVAIYERCLMVQESCEIATKILKIGGYVDSRKNHDENMQAFITGRLGEL